MRECSRLDLYMFMVDIFKQISCDYFCMDEVRRLVTNEFGGVLNTSYCKHIMNVFEVWCRQESIRLIERCNHEH